VPHPASRMRASYGSRYRSRRGASCGQMAWACAARYVSGPAGMRWRERDREVGAQDQGAQVAPRYGSISYDHNIFIGGNHSFMAIFATDVAGDVHGAGDTLTVSDNLFQDTLQDGIVLSRQNAMRGRRAGARISIGQDPLRLAALACAPRLLAPMIAAGVPR
jgi:hypothetical protein